LSRIREKLFHNEESGLSLEGFIDALSGQNETFNPVGTPSKLKRTASGKVDKDLREYQELLVNRQDFTEIAIIGRGHFAEVKLVEEKNSRNSKLYAMKQMSKAQVSPCRAKLERTIMSTAKSDWITKLKFAFQDSLDLFLVMEYCPGGDLRSHLDR
jgi:serine/threonine protein kinase